MKPDGTEDISETVRIRRIAFHCYAIEARGGGSDWTEAVALERWEHLRTARVIAKRLACNHLALGIYP